jgi:hypothetical protein
MRFFKLVLPLMVFCACLAFAAQAHALSITPSYDTPLTGLQTSQALINDAIATTIGGADLLYKSTPGVGEEGPLAGSYNTLFFNTPLDPSGATITYTGGPFVDDAFLLVKDGNHTPAWYLFNLASWNGTETLELSGFWTGPGAISHVALYGTSHSVPEPATMLLLGVGLIGLAGYSRKKFKSN